MSVYTLVFLGTAPIGNSLMGTFADAVGSAKAVGVAAFLCIIAAVIFSLKMSKG